jgi:hypothetical protein
MRGSVRRPLVRACLVAVVVLQATAASAQVGYAGSVFFVRLDTAEGDRSDGLFIMNSVDGERGILRASATLPLLAQRSRWAVPDAEPIQEPWNFGLADPIFRADIGAWRSRAHDSSVRLSGSIKVPIASVDQGFSSGETDYAVGVSWSRFRGRHSVLTDVTYWVVGDTADVNFRNVPSFYVGYGRVLDEQYRWSAIVSASATPAVVPESGHPAQVGIAVLRMLGPGRALGISVHIGLNDSAADLAIGSMWRFPL